MLSVISLLSVVGLAAAGTQDIIIPPVKEGKTEVALILVQGASIPPSAYQPLAQAIQNATDAKLWVGLPEFPLDTPIPVDSLFASYIDALLKEMHTDAGMGADVPIIIAGHSLGGASLQGYTANNPDLIKGQILMGSTLLRKYYNNTGFMGIPSMMLSGDLDGLLRVTRMAESYNKFEKEGAPKKTVLVIPGMNHMDVASGAPPSFVKNNDLPSELSQEQAHTIIAGYASEFILNVMEGASAKGLQEAMAKTGDLVKPLVDAMKYEGSYLLNPPCNSDNPSPHCPYYPPYPTPKYLPTPSVDTTCTCSSPFVLDIAMKTMAGLGDEAKKYPLLVADAFHSVKDINPVHLPHIWNDCSGSTQFPCALNLTTLTENVYEKGEDLDTGKTFNTAKEVRAKMISRQNLFTKSVNKVADFNVTDASSICMEINQQAYEWALSNAGSRALARYKTNGTQLSFAEDIVKPAVGPLWINALLQFKTVTDAGGVKTLQVAAPTMKTDVNSTYIPGFPDPRGFHYCKLLSPARAMEHIYIDSLRD